jgi:hypothetical protein
MRAACLSFVLLAACLAAPVSAQCPETVPVQGAPPPQPVFPADNWWNLDISAAPVDANSAAYIDFIGATKGMHPDFGGEAGGDEVYGFPYAIVDSEQPRLPVTFEVWDESDGVDFSTHLGTNFYPIPIEAIDQPHWIEGGPAGTVDLRASSDRHLIMIDCTGRFLYELYNVWYNDVEDQWYGYSGAFFDLQSNARRPDGWTSADAAGLAIFPGLVRYDEASDETKEDLGHALRMTVRDTNGYVYPASHNAGDGVGAPPLGTRLRLKKLANGQDPVLRTDDPMARRIFRTMQKYGLIVADNGSDMYVSGTFDTRWNNDVLNPAFDLIEAGDFEVIQLGWDPAAAVLTVADVAVAEGNAGTRSLTFTVRLAEASVSPVTYDIATANGSAAAGSDYTALSLAGQEIPAGQLSKTFTVTLFGDTAVEGNETVLVTVSNAHNATIADGQAVGTILNDDGTTVSIADVAVGEGNAGTKLATFTVVLSKPSAAPVTFNVATVDGTAVAGSDYEAFAAGGQSIPAGQLSKAISVTINGDTALEANQFFKVNLGGVAGATLFDGQAIGTILNDEGPTLSIADLGLLEGPEGNMYTVTFTVTLSQASPVPIYYNIATQNFTALNGSDYMGRALTGQRIPAGVLSKTFSVATFGDNFIEANEAFLVNLSNATVSLYDGQAQGQIFNDDGTTLSIGDASITEGNSGTKLMTFTVTLSQAETVPVTYTLETRNGTASGVSDYVHATSNEVIPAGMLSKTFSVTIKGDPTVEANETFKVNVTNNSVTMTDGQGIGTIVNDD